MSSFAEQTGQPCETCHVGGYGPQLRPFGRELKLRGYSLRADVSHYSKNRIGATIAGFDTWGSKDAIIYDGSASGSPNASGVTLQLDFTPYGAVPSPMGGRFNARVSVQYTAYMRFDGGRSNYDGMGRDASDNNTLRVFATLAF